MHLTPFSISGLMLFFTCLILFCIIWVNGKSKLHRLWAYFNVAVGIWGLGSFFISIGATESAARLSWRLSHIGVIFIAVFFFHVICNFCEISRRKAIIAAYLQGVLFLALNTTDLFIFRMKYVFDSYYYTQSTGPFYPAFFAIWLTLVLYGHYELFKFYKKAQGIKRNQALYLFLGMIVGFAGGTTNFFPMFGLNMYPWGNFTISIYCIIVTYAILRHQLLDIEVIIKRAVVFAGLFAGVYGVLTLFTFLTQDLLMTLTGGNKWISLVPAIAIITLALRPLENFLTTTTDKYLFQKKYDYREVLKAFTAEVLSVLDIDKLVRLTVDKISNIMKIESCSMLLLNKAKNQYELVASVGLGKKSAILESGNTLVTFLVRTRLYLSIKDQGTDSKLPDRILYDMNKLKLEVAIPLNIHDEMVGILTLGSKKSGADYTQDDMTILLTVARSLSIAINNAEMFDELGKTQAEAAQREKMAVIGTLASGINHEICNPLGIARGQCEVFLLNARDGLYEGRPKDEQIYEAMKIMEKVIKETDRATAITKKLSTFAKPGSGEMEKVNIFDVINEVMALIGHDLKMDKIEVINNVSKKLPSIVADKKQIEEILFNLIRNAGQAIDERGCITINALLKEGKIIINIEDTGHGIPEDKLQQIFNPFYTTKAPGKGTGLGLFIVRQVVQRNKGTISVKSKVGVGTMFTLQFPVPKGRKS